jgi:hypothetical protein
VVPRFGEPAQLAQFLQEAHRLLRSLSVECRLASLQHPSFLLALQQVGSTMDLTRPPRAGGGPQPLGGSEMGERLTTEQWRALVLCLAWAAISAGKLQGTLPGDIVDAEREQWGAAIEKSGLQEAEFRTINQTFRGSHIRPGESKRVTPVLPPRIPPSATLTEEDKERLAEARLRAAMARRSDLA